MADTNFVDGVTTVGASFLNQIFGSNGHVHDGQDQDGSAPKVDLKDHVQWDGDGDGTAEGEMEVTTDTASEHEVTHRHTGSGDSNFISDFVEAADRFMATIIQGNAQDYVEFRSSSQPGVANSGEIRAAILSLGTKLITQQIHGLSADIISVFDFNGNSGEGGFELATLRQGLSDLIDVEDGAGNAGEGGFKLDTLQAGTGDTIDVNDSGGVTGEGSVHALNTIRAWARVTVSGGSIDSVNGKSITAGDVTRSSTGKYSVQAPNVTAGYDSRVVYVQPLSETSPSGDFYIVDVDDGSSVSVDIYDVDVSGGSVTAADADFDIVFLEAA